MRACFHIFGRVYLSLGANPLSHFLAEVFLKTGLWSVFLESLIDFLVNLEPKLWPKNQSFDKNKVSQNVLLAISDQILASHKT